MRTLLIAILFLLPFSARAETLPEISTIEAYLKSMTTIKSRFIQTSDNHQVAGDFLLKRPGRMKFTYDAPIEDFIVADGFMIYYYDSQLKEQSSAPVSQSLADFFLRENLKLSGDVAVSDIKREGGYLQVTLAQTKDPLAGNLTLAFEENPMQLKKWRVVDAQGIVTEVELFEIASGVKLDNDLFHYYDPKRKKPKYN